MNKKQIGITLGLMCLILTCAIMVQLRTTQNATATVGESFSDSGLKDEVLRWKEKYDTTYRELENVQKELEKERKQSISTDDGAMEKQEELKRLNTILGLTEVSGEGIIITMKDNVTTTMGTSNDLIHDGDLRSIINELKNAGAEAISINEQRIVSSTAITCIGTVIQINDEKIGTPFEIKVIGNQSSLIGGMQRAGGYLNRLTDAGIPVDVKKSSNILIPKYNGVFLNKYTKNVE